MFDQKEEGDSFANKRGKEVLSGKSLAQQGGDIKVKENSGLICRPCQKKGHLSYGFRYPTPIPCDEAIVQLNIEEDQNQPLDRIPDFQFLNLE